MRNALTAAVGLAFFFGTACGSSGSTTAGTTGGASGTPTTGGGGSTSSGSASATTGGPAGGGTTTSSGPAKESAGQACTSNDSCGSGVCDLNGSGNCCSSACLTDNSTCAATGCDDGGACIYPTTGSSCGSSCQYGMFTASLCNNGACSAQTPVPCPNNLACNSAGTACAGSCSPDAGGTDCSNGWYCAAGVCTPQISNGACTSNAECVSNVCGINGTGHCCTQTACTNTTAPCGSTDCDGVSGACTFAPNTTSCDTGAVSCSDSHTQVDPNTSCDGQGNCPPPVLTDCTPYACEASGCVTSCATSTDCTTNYWCNAGACVPQQAVGPCTTNAACFSGQCGAAGTGNCCVQNCPSAVQVCGITDCDPSTGACLYPSGLDAPCGSVSESCTALIQQNPSVCDGQGNCPTPGTTDCSPFACGPSSCFTSCSDNSSCAPGDSCSVAAGVCCPGILTGGTINVDSVLGNDSATCCGAPGYTPCASIGQAMTLINAARAPNVTINASVKGASGDWTSSENYPVVLGWGVELLAPGVNFAPFVFNEGNNPINEIFDIKSYSSKDTVGYASIAGNAANGPVQVGISGSNSNPGTQEVDATNVIQVESGQHLYLTNANVNGSANYQTTALNIAAGGSVTFGGDQPNTNLGPVVIGNSSDNFQYWGFNGIVCQTDNTSQTGCTVDDVTQAAGVSALTIQGQWNQDIDAEDFANITLTANPVVGVAPVAVGFAQCAQKVDTNINYSGSAAILLNGAVTMTFSNGQVQCLWGTGFQLQASPFGNANPLLTMTGTTIQNTNLGVYASAGVATIANSTIQYNYMGVEQDTDGINTATINLSGGTIGGTNTVACTSTYENSTFNPFNNGFNPSIAVLNNTSAVLNASDVDWDTAGPDLFLCNPLTSCTCEIAACTNAGGVDGMDAVYESTGTITTTGNGLSPLDCTPPPLCGEQICSGGTTCCQQFGGECLQPGEFCNTGGCGGCDCGCGECGGCGFPCGILCGIHACGIIG